MSSPDPVRRLATEELTEAEAAVVRAILRDAFAGDGEGFTSEDWAHALGGAHFLLEQDGAIVAHAAVVERELHAGGVPIRSGYVEAVATHPADQCRGHGSRLMEAVNDHIRATFPLGALSAAAPAFYARLGWERWLGPTAVRTAETITASFIVVPRNLPAGPRAPRRLPASCPRTDDRPRR